MKKIVLSIMFFVSFIICSAAHADNSDPSVVAQVDLNKYAGKWYEIGRFPTFFQRDCVRSTAEYQVQPDNTLSVYNVCFKNDGSTSDISGVAKVVDTNVPAKLRVRFNIFAQGDYWIVSLDPNYQWAVVSSAGKSSLFILARTAPMQIELRSRIVADLKARGFDTDRLVFDQY